MIDLIVKNAWMIGLIGLSFSFAGAFLLIFSYARYPGPGATYTKKERLIYLDYHLTPIRSRIGAILLSAGFFLQAMSYVALKPA